jgi:hypothetical protein
MSVVSSGEQCVGVVGGGIADASLRVIVVVETAP